MADQLPLLDTVRAMYPFAILDEVYIICAQHLLGTSAVLFSNLFQLGLDPDNFSVIGKCYSTNPSVYLGLKNRKGLDVCSSSQQFFPDRSFDSQYKESIEKFFELRLKKILDSGCKNLIVVDDGGELIQTVNEHVKNNSFPMSMKIVGVEQTSSGFTKLQLINLTFPVINVARSEMKLHLESSLIGDAIITNLLEDLKEISFNPTKALILGNGVIGSKVKERMSRYCKVDSYDLLTDRSSIGSFEEIEFDDYNLIVGCSGKEVINPSILNNLRHKTVLASGSSSDREFCGGILRSQLGLSPNCHDHINVNEVCLLNCGFPVNFSSRYNLVDDERYQLTRSLLLAGILQACFLTTASLSFVEIESAVQHILSKEFLLLYPDFCQCP